MKFKKFVKQNYGYILLAIILLVIFLASFVNGKYLLSNDNYSPELNPMLTILRSLLSPAWRSYRVLGFASESEQADIFRSIFFLFGDLILDRQILGQVYYLICLSVGSIYIGKLGQKFSHREDLKGSSQLIFLLTAFTYISTLWTIWTFYQSMGPYITNFGFLPVLLFYLYSYIKDSTSKNALKLFFASIFLTGAYVIATLFVTDFIIIILFIIAVSILEFKTLKTRFKKIVKSLSIFISSQLFWVLPFILYTFTISGDIIGSYTNRTITSSVIDLETSMQSAINTARLYSRILTDSDGTDYLFPLTYDFQTYDFYKIIGLMPAFFSVIGMLFALVKKNWKMILFFCIAFGSWFIMKVGNPPLGEIFMWMQNNIPLFKQVFRWPSSKLSEIYLISISLLSSVGIVYLFEFLISFIKKIKIKKILWIFSITVIMSLQFIYAGFLFDGNLISKKSLIDDIPVAYYQLEEYLNENDSNGRIYYAPPANNNYFREYDWGFRGSQFISYIIPNPMMDMSSAVGSSYGENAMLDILKVFKAGDSDRFLNLMNKYDVQYILVDHSLVADGFTYDIDWDLSETLWNDYELIWHEDFLSLYSVPLEESSALVESLGLEDINYFTREYSKTPTLDLLDLELENLSVDGNIIKGNFVYNGDTLILNSTLKNEDISQLPSKYLLTEVGIVKTPVFPTFDVDESVLPSKTYNINEHYDYYSLNNFVLTRESLLNYVFLESSFDKNDSIYGIEESSFVKHSLTEELLTSEGGDCSNNASQYIVNLEEQGNSLGLSLSSESNLPCIYGAIDLEEEMNYVAKVHLNWESEENIFAGYCLFSEEDKRCLNTEAFLYTSDPYGSFDLLIPEVLYGNSQYSLILYALNLDDSKDSEIVFRDVAIELAPLSKAIQLTEINDSFENNSIILETGVTYEVQIPVLISETSYSYVESEKENLIWQPNVLDSSTADSTIKWQNGLWQEVTEGFVNQSNTLFSTAPNQEYLLYFEGENFSNIRANICLTYLGDEECWYQDMFLDEGDSSFLTYFESNSEYTNTLNAIFNSVSYSSESQNVLKNLVVMEIPSSWQDLRFENINAQEYVEIEMSSVGSAFSTVYGISKNDILKINTIVTIPQSESYGWIAFSIGNGFSIVDTDVLVNGWKQGWDITNLDFDNIYVFYYPNLLSYFGYLVIVVTVVILIIKLVKEKKYGRK